ncbi:MAG: prevent-host-death protein [Gallionella sp.]|jgi:predicted transcriptional regulator|nr:prevent-host-death protein [Gallionella sp.]MCK9353898.1 prevent-host-death protein [Gallionella sp.]
MKTATMPALRAQPELRQAAEEILRPGETLSAFVEDSVRRNVELRRAQQEFIVRGLASRDAAKKSGVYISSEEVLQELDDMLVSAKRRPVSLVGRVRPQAVTRHLDFAVRHQREDDYL